MERGRAGSFVWGALLALALGSVSACAGGEAAAAPASDVAAPADSPADWGDLPDFELVASDGRRVTRASLLGKPWVLSALYTTCTGPCPAVFGNLQRLQAWLGPSGARLVTVSVDPERDTPEVLAQAAARLNADPQRWWLLSGERAAVERFVREGLWCAVDRDDRGELTHDTRLLVVDGQGRRRGWYPGGDAAGLASVRARVEWLAQQERR